VPAPSELFDACAEASAPGPRWRHGKLVLWLMSPAIQVAGRTWQARGAKHTAGSTGVIVHGYSARQCAQVAAALLPVMAASAAEAERHAAAVLGLGGT
jgi:hypothetical protein